MMIKTAKKKHVQFGIYPAVMVMLGTDTLSLCDVIVSQVVEVSCLLHSSIRKILWSLELKSVLHHFEKFSF